LPENDLGTAHGRIRVDFDDRGSGKALVALEKISAQMESMNKRLGAIQKTVEDFDKSMDRSSASMDKASKAAKGFTSDIFSAHKSVNAFSRDLRSLYQDFNKLQTAVGNLSDMTKPFRMGAKALDQFHRSLADGNGKIGAFNKALIGSGVAAKVFNKQLGLNMLGVKKAMAEMPTWTQNAYRYAGGIAKVGTAAVVLNKLADSGRITKYVNAFANVEPVRKMLLEHEKLAVGVEKAFQKIEGAPKKFATNFQPFHDFAKSSRGFLTGTALINSGINDIAERFRWLGKIPKPILHGLAVSIADVVPAALHVLGKSLQLTSNLFLGALQGATQLAGGLAVLPGLYATIGAAVTPLIGVFAGLKDKFKDVFSDDWAKSLQAYMNLPPHLRVIADALKPVITQFKELQTTLQKVAFKGVENDIKSLSESYMPRLADAGIKVVLAWRQMKDEVVGFFKEAQTQKDFSQIYTNTAQALIAMGRAIRPALDGLRDITVVGNQFITDLAGGLPRLTQQFAQWARTNRENGNAMLWMQNARAGVVDLTKGAMDLTRALWQIVTVFRTAGAGTNFLQVFADDMKKLNAAMGKSAFSGILADLRQLGQSMADRNISNFKSLWKDITELVHNFIPVLNTLAQSFSGSFIPFLKLAAEELGIVLQVIHSMGLDAAIASIYGMVAGWKAFSAIAVPIITKGKLIVGVFMTLSNVPKIVMAVDTAVTKLVSSLSSMGGIGAKVGQSVANVAGSMTKVITVAAAMIGPLTAVAVGIGAAMMVTEEADNQVKSFNNALQESKNHVAEFGVSIGKTFMQDNGLAGHNVIDAISQRLNQMVQDLKNVESAAPGPMNYIKNTLRNMPSVFGIGMHFMTNGDDLKSMEQVAAKAELARKGLEHLKNTGVDLNSVVRQSDQAFGQWAASTASQGKEAALAVQQLTVLHNQYISAQKDMIELGPAGVQAANGIDRIAKSAGDAQSKLEGLRTVLQALGLLQINSLEAAAKYADAIEGLSKKVSDAIESGDGLSGVWDRVNNTLNVTGSQTARNLVPVFKDLSEAFMQNAVFWWQRR
jgi:hypothetical protein